MKHTTILTSLAAALLATAALAAAPGGAFDSVMEPYETVRQALVADDFAAVAAPAAELAEAVGRLGGQLSAEAAGVPADDLDDVRELLPEVRSAAASLAAAGDLEAARDAFYALTKPLVRWRQAADEGPAVVYCSMKKRSWLQPAGDGDVGNPYYGQSMASCGKVMSR